jgi:hypothetical protein
MELSHVVMTVMKLVETIFTLSSSVIYPLICADVTDYICAGTPSDHSNIAAQSVTNSSSNC